MHVPKEERKKLDARASEGVFVNYDQHSKAFRCYSQRRRKIIIARNVKFDEKSFANEEKLNVDPFPLSFPNYGSSESSRDEECTMALVDHSNRESTEESSTGIFRVTSIELPHVHHLDSSDSIPALQHDWSSEDEQFLPN